MKNIEFNSKNTNIWNATFSCPFCSTRLLNYYHIAETTVQTVTCPDCRNSFQTEFKKEKDCFCFFIKQCKAVK